jgi:hypothetical protein
MLWVRSRYLISTRRPTRLSYREMRPQLLRLSSSRLGARLPLGGRKTDRSCTPGAFLTGHNAPPTASRIVGRTATTVSQVVHFTAGDERFRDDRGEADPRVAAALAAFAAGTGTEQAALTALAKARLLVPVIAVLADDVDEGSDPVPGTGGEKASDMATPVIVGRDGRPALPAFTSLEALYRWQPGARPVPVPAEGVWQSAVEDSSAVVIDIAGPVPLAVEGARLAALAAGAQVPAIYDDPDVWRLAVGAAAQVAPGIRVRLAAPERGLDFTLELAPPQGAAEPVPEDVASRIAEALAGLLAGRARSGIAVVCQPGRGNAPT